MIEFNMKLEGAAEIEKQWQKLANKEVRKITSRSMRDGAKIFQRQTKRNILSMLGKATFAKSGRLRKGESKRLSGSFAANLAKDITVRAAKKRRRHEVKVISGTHNKSNKYTYYPLGASSDLSTGKTNNKPSFIPAAIEYGHRLVFMGRDTGRRVAPIPFMRKAFEAKKQEARGKVLRAWYRGIVRGAKVRGKR